MSGTETTLPGRLELTPHTAPRLTPARLRIYQAQTRRNLAYVREVNAQLDMRQIVELKTRIRVAAARAGGDSQL